MKTKPASKKKQEVIRAYVDTALYREVMRAAEDEGRNQSNMVARLVEEALETRKKPK
jgi:hypothetical protein